MLRAFTFTSLFLLSCLGFAHQPAPLYQVDMIVFTQLQASLPPTDHSISPLLAPNVNNAIVLQNNAPNKMTPYSILPTSASHLRNEYWALNRKPQYQVLFHHTWLQPGNNQRPIALSQAVGGWNVEGTLRVRRSNYYLLDTELLFSTPNSTQTAFMFTQKQRLKPDVVYYLDHPQAGMLIKIHQVI
jgi:hypothetical protein